MLQIHYEKRLHLYSEISATAIHKSIIVHCVASWQSCVENLTYALHSNLHLTTASENPNTILNFIRNFSTPSSQKVSFLFNAFNINITNSWTFDQSKKVLLQLNGVIPQLLLKSNYNKLSIDEELDAWVNLRHQVAHGDENIDLTNMSAIYPQVNRLSRISSWQCLNFFYSLGLTLIKDTAKHLNLDEAPTNINLNFLESNLRPIHSISESLENIKNKEIDLKQYFN